MQLLLVRNEESGIDFPLSVNGKPKTVRLLRNVKHFTLNVNHTESFRKAPEKLPIIILKAFDKLPIHIDQTFKEKKII
jgi:hypothetical protein